MNGKNEIAYSDADGSHLENESPRSDDEELISKALEQLIVIDRQMRKVQGSLDKLFWQLKKSKML